MAELPDDVETEGTPERAVMTVRLDAYPSEDEAIDGDHRIELARLSLIKIMQTAPFLEWSTMESKSPGFQEYEITLSADRTGIVAPMLDELCEALRRHFPDLHPQVRVPGYERAFFGWCRTTWTQPRYDPAAPLMED
jgi:hypothetical protein